MNLWRWIGRKFPKGQRRGALAARQLGESYERVFTGNGSKEDAEIVLADLANYTGFYRANGPGFMPEDRAHSDGMRCAFGRIFQFLRLSDEERRALEEAARHEAIVDVEERDI